MEFKDYVQLGSAVFVGTGVMIAAFSYRHQTRTRRAEWMKILFEKFYETETFKEVRQWIESGEIEKKIKPGLKVSGADEKLADYLNFFEFVAVLKSDSQLKFRDISNMFDYYLRKLKNSEAVMNWIQDESYGFEKLRNLLDNMK